MNMSMLRKYCITILLLVLPSFVSAYKVGLCIVATGKYTMYAEKLIESARKYFCKNHQITYFVFTDGQITPAHDVVQVFQKRLGWPLDTLMRFSMYHKHSTRLNGMDYLFAIDADMLFVHPVGDEIFADLVATQHPGYVGRRGTYEQDSISTACVKSNEGTYYLAGGFFGGSTKAFLTMARQITHRINLDLAHNFIAVWHDESHLNRYFIDMNYQCKILSPSYCYPERWHLPYKKIILALDKNHAQMRKI